MFLKKKHRQILRMANQKLSGDREDFDGISDEEMAERLEEFIFVHILECRIQIVTHKSVKQRKTL